LAARDFNIALPLKPRPWWEVFIGNQINKGNELVDVANAILGTCNLHLGMEKGHNILNEPSGIDGSSKGGVPNERKNNDDDDINLYSDWLAASKGFIRSLVNNSNQDNIEKSFNDPDSFLWFCQKETFDKEIQTN